MHLNRSNKLLATFFISILLLISYNVYSQTISFGPEFGGVTEFSNSESKIKTNFGFNAGLYFNISVINGMGFDAKILYEHFNKNLAYVNFTPFFQYYGKDYIQFGIAPLLYIKNKGMSFDFNNPKLGVSFSFGNKYLGANLSLLEFQNLQYENHPTVKFSAHVRLGFIDKFIR